MAGSLRSTHNGGLESEPAPASVERRFAASPLDPTAGVVQPPRRHGFILLTGRIRTSITNSKGSRLAISRAVIPV